VLYDVSSSYMEGRCCPLAKRGNSRDRKKGTLQITYGLLCAPDGCPIAIEVFDGDTADPMTLATQIEKLKQRFRLERVVMVGDRGTITQARITDEIKSAGLDWITALRAPAIKWLLQSGALQLSLFDQRDMASITKPDFPDERLVVCRNPDLAAERSRKREELLAATELILPASRRPWRANAPRCAVRQRSRSRSAPSSIGTRWPSISRSTFQTRPSAAVYSTVSKVGSLAMALAVEGMQVADLQHHAAIAPRYASCTARLERISAGGPDAITRP